MTPISNPPPPPEKKIGRKMRTMLSLTCIFQLIQICCINLFFNQSESPYHRKSNIHELLKQLILDTNINKTTTKPSTAAGSMFTFSRRFHSGSHVDSVPKQAVSGHGRPHHPRGTSSCVETNPQL